MFLWNSLAFSVIQHVFMLSRSVVSNSLWPCGCSQPGSFVHGDSPGKNTGVCCHSLLQGIFSTQESNPGLPHCRLILYHKQPGTPMIQQAIWSLIPLPLWNLACTSGSSWFTYCWNLAWRILSITLLACEMRAINVVIWTFFGITLLWDWNEKWLFPVSPLTPPNFPIWLEPGPQGSARVLSLFVYLNIFYFF